MKQSKMQVMGLFVLTLIIVAYQFVPVSEGNKASLLRNYEINNDGGVNVTPADKRTLFNLSDFNNAIVDIAQATKPTVVTITTKSTVTMRNNPLMEFFGNPNGQGTERTQRGLGSGVIVSEDGYIITNNHVIEDADEVNVMFIDGEEIEAEIIGADRETDIAVLKVDVRDLPYIKIGNSEETRVGEFVLAIGSPLDENLAHTVSFGIVSAKGRTIGLLQGRDYLGFEDFIQTDAAINPGNSGGALINLNGELVGINSAIASRSGGNDGIGFSIPVNLAARIMEDLIEDGTVSRGFLGINGSNVDRTLALGLGIDDVRGIIISMVQEGSPADKAGLMEGDIITAINGEEVRDYFAFRTEVAAYKPGDQIKLDILRDGDAQVKKVELGKRPDMNVAEVPESEDEVMEAKLGFNIAALNSDIRRQLDLAESVEGVVVNRIENGSEAYERGLRRGDIITQVSRSDIDNPYDFYEEIKELLDKNSKVALITVKRGDANEYIAFRL